MNMVTSEPKVADTDLLPIGKAAAVLGIDRSTLRRYAAKGRRNGGIDPVVSRNGIGQRFTGRELKRFWRQF